MYDWLPDLANDLRTSLVSVYWLLIIPLTLIVIILEYFKAPEGNPEIFKVMKRVLLSIFLLISFDEVMGILSWLGEGVVSYLGGKDDISVIWNTMSQFLDSQDGGWFKIKGTVIWIFTFIAFVLAYVGVFFADALIHFCWALLYIVSPLMQLCFIPEATKNICKNLYQCLFTILTWKVLWVILSKLLLKFSTSAQVTEGNEYNYFLLIVINLFIGLSMLLIPFATKSLIGDGFSSFTTSLAAIPTLLVKGAFVQKIASLVKKSPKAGWRASRWAGRKGVQGAKASYAVGKVAREQIAEKMQNAKVNISPTSARGMGSLQAHQDRVKQTFNRHMAMSRPPPPPTFTKRVQTALKPYTRETKKTLNQRKDNHGKRR